MKELREDHGVVVLRIARAVDERHFAAAPELLDALALPLELTQVAGAKLVEPLRVVPEPLAQLRARRKLLRPLVDPSVLALNTNAN